MYGIFGYPFSAFDLSWAVYFCQLTVMTDNGMTLDCGKNTFFFGGGAGLCDIRKMKILVFFLTEKKGPYFFGEIFVDG